MYRRSAPLPAHAESFPLVGFWFFPAISFSRPNTSPRAVLPSRSTMEAGASNKDLARARFKQQQHGRRVHGRGGGTRGRFGRKKEPGAASDDDDEQEEEEAAVSGRVLDLPPGYDDADETDPSTGPRSRSNGADLAALLAECDASALPRQHISAYMDPGWSVDDLRELQRVLGPDGGAGVSGDEMSVDAPGLIRQLRELPLSELLGLSRQYAEALGEGPEEEAEEGARGVDEGKREGTGPRASTPAEPPRVPAQRAPAAAKDEDDDLDALLAGSTRTPAETARGPSAVGDGELDDELDDLLGISTGAEGKRGAVGAGGGASATAAARTDDDAFLDELLG